MSIVGVGGNGCNVAVTVMTLMGWAVGTHEPGFAVGLIVAVGVIVCVGVITTVVATILDTCLGKYGLTCCAT